MNSELEIHEADIVLRSRNNEKGLMEFYELALELVVNSMGELSALFYSSFDSMSELIKCKMEEIGSIKISHTLENHEAHVMSLTPQKRDPLIPIFKEGSIESLQPDQIKAAVGKIQSYVDQSFKVFEIKKSDFTNLQRFLSEIWTLLAEFSKEFPSTKEVTVLSMTCLQNFSTHFHSTFHDFLSMMDQISIHFLQTSSNLNSIINRQMNVIIEDQNENEAVTASQAKLIMKKLYADQSLGAPALIAARNSLSTLFKGYYQQEDARTLTLQKMLKEYHMQLVQSCLHPLFLRAKEFTNKLRTEFSPQAIKEEVYKILIKNQKLSVFIDDWMSDIDETNVESPEASLSRDHSQRNSFESRGISKVQNNDFKFIGALNTKQLQQAKEMIFTPSKASKRGFSKDLMYKFNAMENEIIIDTFSCTFSDNLLLQGRLYVTTKRLAFQSPFNVKTIFGETVVVVPNGEIKSLERDKLLFGMSNILHINTVNGRVTFSSFMKSEKAINLINDVLSKTSQIYQGILNQNNNHNTQKEEPEEEEKGNELLEQEELANNNAEGGKKKGKNRKKTMAMQYAKAISLRRKQVIAQIVHKNQYDHTPLDYNIENTNFQKVFKVLFADTPLDIDGKNYVSFWELLVDKGLVSNYDVRKWNPPPPTQLGNLKELAEFPLFSERTISGSKPLKVAVPLFPKDILYKQSDQLLILDSKEVWVTSTNVVLNKIPLSDCFIFKQAFIIKEVNESTVNLQMRWFVDFTKSTMFKGTVLSSTDRENKDFANDVILKCVKQLSEMGMFEVKPEDVYQPEEVIEEDQDEEEDEKQQANNPTEEIEALDNLNEPGTQVGTEKVKGDYRPNTKLLSRTIGLAKTFKNSLMNPTKQGAHAALIGAVLSTALYLAFTLFK